MKKHTYAVLLALLTTATSAVAIELAPDTPNPVPSLFAQTDGSTVSYQRSVIAYSPKTFNIILESYGLSLTPEAVKEAPFTYAKASGENVSFSNSPTAYDPSQYHSIFTAYGLELSVQAAKEKLGAINYARIVNGKPVFSKSPMAYSGDELALILSVYNLPMAALAQPQDSVTVKAVDSDKDGVIDVKDQCPDTPKGAKIDDRGCWVLNAAYLFDFDKSVIKAQYLPYLDDVVKVLGDNPTLRIEIQGHTDSIGTEQYNQGLSERRAKAVKSYLENKGIKPERLTTKGFGESSPVNSNQSSEGRSKNRRVQLKPQWQ